MTQAWRVSWDRPRSPVHPLLACLLTRRTALDFCSDKFRQGWAEDSDNIGTVDDLLDAYIALYNDSISKIPADMHTGVHLCRGNVGHPLRLQKPKL